MSVDAKITLGALPAALLKEAYGLGVPKIVHAAMDAAINAAGPLVQRELTKRTPSGATGKARQHVYFERNALSGVPSGFVGYSGPPSLYMGFVDAGTKPHFPPPAALAYWAQRKLGVPADQAASVGYLIARSIAKKGTKPRNVIGDTATAVRPRVQGVMTAAAIRSIQAWAQGSGAGQGQGAA